MLVIGILLQNDIAACQCAALWNRKTAGHLLVGLMKLLEEPPCLSGAAWLGSPSSSVRSSWLYALLASSRSDMRELSCATSALSNSVYPSNRDDVALLGMNRSLYIGVRGDLERTSKCAH